MTRHRTRIAAGVVATAYIAIQAFQNAVTRNRTRLAAGIAAIAIRAFQKVTP